jgi:F-type H+-transporting ATPase subunit b
MKVYKYISLGLCFLCLTLASSLAYAEAEALSQDEKQMLDSASSVPSSETPQNITSTASEAGQDTAISPDTAMPTAEEFMPEGSSLITEDAVQDMVVANLDEAAPQEKKGLPQLKIETFASQIFWLLVSFVLMYVAMAKMTLPKMAKILSVRESTRTNNLERAKELSDSAEKLRDGYERDLRHAHDKAHTLITQTEQAMSKETTARQAEFLENTKTRIADAEAKIKQAKDEALKSLNDVALDATIETVKRVSGITINKMDAQKYVATSMKEKA